MLASLPLLLAEIGTKPVPTGWENFWSIISRADNVPIVFMIALFGYFTWYSLKMGLDNDKLTREGRRDEILRKMQE
jgi:hypothetical protein